MPESDRPSRACGRLALAAVGLALVPVAAVTGLAAPRPADAASAPNGDRPGYAVASAGAGGWQAAASGGRAPRSGRYTGPVGGRPGFFMYVASGRVQVVSFPFACRGATAQTSLSYIRIRRIDGTYRFAVRAYGIVTYSDERPDENATVAIRGTFARSGTAVSGLLTVRTPRCGVRRDVRWSARRR